MDKKKSHFTVTLTGQLSVVCWTVAHLATVHKMKQMLFRYMSFIWNTFLCVECLTKCCENRMYCAVVYVGCVCIQWTLRHWQCDSTVLGEWFVVFGRIVVPSSSVSSGVWLDPEDDGVGHTATQCPVTEDLNLPTVTFANLYSPSAYILTFCVIFVTEVNVLLYRYWLNDWLHCVVIQLLTDCTVLLYSYWLTALCCYTATDW